MVLYDQCFYQGLNLIFGNISDYETLLVFIRDYVFYNLSKYETSILLGHVASEQIEDNISDVIIKNNQICIELKEKGIILLNQNHCTYFPKGWKVCLRW